MSGPVCWLKGGCIHPKRCSKQPACNPLPPLLEGKEREMAEHAQYVEHFISLMEAEGYRNVRELPDGKFAGVGRMLFGGNIFVGLTEGGWERTYFYETEIEAMAALSCWDGEGDPPGMWLKEKPSERLGPGAPMGAKLDWIRKHGQPSWSERWRNE